MNGPEVCNSVRKMSVAELNEARGRLEELGALTGTQLDLRYEPQRRE